MYRPMRYPPARQLFTLTPQERYADGSRVRFDCLECGHSEVFVRLRYVDVAHVLGNDHYWDECTEVRWEGVQHPQIAAHRAELARRHREQVA